MVRQQEEPARILQLLRHAKSSWQDADLDDRDRPLNARGHQAGRLLAAHLAGQAAPDLVLCSSALRTRETFDHIAGAYRATPQAAFEDALYLASARTLLGRIEAVAEEIGSLLVIGHNPGLHELALKLARHGPRRDRARLAAKFPTAALASFRFTGRWHAIAHAPIALTSYVIPADLGELAAERD